MRLKKDVAKLVARERVCRVATAGRDGMPHVVPVCHVLVDGKLCFGSDDDARKVKNVRANPRVAVTVDVYSDDWSVLRGVLLQGSATIVEDGPRFRKLRKLLYEKYPQYPEESALENGVVMIEVTPERVFTWGFE